MQEQFEKTKKFMLKINDPVNESLPEYKTNVFVSEYLKDVAKNCLLSIAKDMEDMLCHDQDPRLLRAELMIEELGEAILGLANCDEAETLDGLSDLGFVTIGTAVTFGLPIVDGIDEVCDSNLTKTRRKNGDPRLRDKGDDYVPPNMARIISLHRGIDVRVQRTNCVGVGQTYQMTVKVKRKYHEELRSWWIYVIGGVTGYESMREDDVKTHNVDGWCACAGTSGKYDTLFFPAAAMKEIQEWLEQ